MVARGALKSLPHQDIVNNLITNRRMRIDVITLFPGMFSVVTEYGVTGRAVDRGLLSLHTWDPREFTTDPHRTVDDRPYGGGPGMVMKIKPLRDAIHAAKKAQPDAPIVYLSPQGQTLDHDIISKQVLEPGLILLAGRYEGVDERLIESEVDAEWSIGDYVLSGGEIAALVVIDALTRQIPGVLGDPESARQDSFFEGFLDCPHYTRPETFQGQSVPQVLLSGDHAAIQRWRLMQSIGRTWLRRPDLINRLGLTPEQKVLLEEFQKEHMDKVLSGEDT